MSGAEGIGWGVFVLVALAPLTMIANIHNRILGARGSDRFAAAADVIDTVNSILGYGAAAATVLMVLLQFSVVLMRYVFGVNFIQLQELIVYMHGTVFMAAAAYTLLADGHVRVDIFFRAMSAARKALVNLIGVYALLMPFTVVVAVSGYPFVANSWAIWEGSQETSGIQAVYLLKTLILVFAVTLFLQGWSLAVRSLLILTGAGGRDGTQ